MGTPTFQQWPDKVKTAHEEPLGPEAIYPRRSSKIEQVRAMLRSWARSASDDKSFPENTTQLGALNAASGPGSQTSSELRHKPSHSYLPLIPYLSPMTVDHESPSRTAVNELVVRDFATPETSTTSGSTTNSSKCVSSISPEVAGPRDHTTPLSSLDIKFGSCNKLDAASIDSKRTTSMKQSVMDRSELPSIDEQDLMEATKYSVAGVERVASTKIFFETHYNTTCFACPVSPRSLRRRQLEDFLARNATFSAGYKEAMKTLWLEQETQHLREERVMKSRQLVPKGTDRLANSFEVLKVLGKGSFGVVRLVQEKTRFAMQPNDLDSNRKQVFAMKVIRKADMLRNSQEGHLRAERDFLIASEGSRWVVPLIASFQDVSCLYLVMDYMPGGDFLGLLIRDNILTEATTRWYVAEMILCIEESHALKWIHRDIKPDNFLISASGHLKISDFGLAFDGHWSHDQAYYNNHRYSLLHKLGLSVEGDAQDKKDGRSGQLHLQQSLANAKEKHEPRQARSSSEKEPVLEWRNRKGNRTLARSVVGTSQYMAPEVVRGQFYDARCDWWSVAIILYECLYGHTPFLAEEGGRAVTKENIINYKNTFAFPARPPVSTRCQDLIKQLLTDKDDRLCSRRYRHHKDSFLNVARASAGPLVYSHDAEDIKAHRWFKDIRWETLHLQQPPFVPSIVSATDTQYFDEEDPISDFTESADDGTWQLAPASEAEIEAALNGFNRETTMLAKNFVKAAYDTKRLKRMEREIESFGSLNSQQKEYLRGFIRVFGRKERKRPRDKLLRDPRHAQSVLDVRKRYAFKGYSYRRIRKADGLALLDENRLQAIIGGKLFEPMAQFESRGKLFQRGRLSLH